MQCFGEIFQWDTVSKRKVLFEERGWYYYILQNNDGYFAHGCIDSHGGDRVLKHRSTNVVELRCVRCREMAPSHFQAVVVLHQAGRRDGSAS